MSRWSSPDFSNSSCSHGNFNRDLRITMHGLQPKALLSLWVHHACWLHLCIKDFLCTGYSNPEYFTGEQVRILDEVKDLLIQKNTAFIFQQRQCKWFGEKLQLASPPWWRPAPCPEEYTAHRCNEWQTEKTIPLMTATSQWCPQECCQDNTTQVE